MKFRKAVVVDIADSHFDQEHWDRIDELVEQRVSLSRRDPRLMTELADCDVLMLGFQVPTGKEIFEAAPKLKLVNILATAFGTVDLEEATKRGIVVCNLGGYSTESVAEFTIAAILHRIRDLDKGLQQARAGNYGTEGFRVRELKGSTFGVVGLGSIGMRVAELAAGFGAKVMYWSRTKKETPFVYRELDDLVTSSSFISVNVAETEETKGLLNAKNLSLLRPGSVLISTVPASVIETKALVERLGKGDVTYISDHPATTPAPELAALKALANCVLYPGIAYLSEEATLAKQETFIGNLVGALEGRFQNRVNEG